MGKTITINKGDTLSGIAKREKTTLSELLRLNPNITNPNLIIAGNTLNVPSLLNNDLGGTGDSGVTGGDGASTDSASGYQRGEFKTSDEYNTALTNKNTAYDTLTGLGDAKWYYGTDAEGNPVLGDDVLNGMMSDYQNRKFNYDFNSDALYQQYKDKYIKQAKMASADVMGQAAAMTGGYGSSYAQTVGNQAYQSSLGQLNDVIPELYQLAYAKYGQEGQDLLNSISLLRGERDNYFTRYNEDYSRASGELDYWTNLANSLYNRDYTAYTTDETHKYNTWRDSVEDQQWQDTFDLGKKQYEDSLYANAGGQYKVDKDENGNPVITPDLDATIEAQNQPTIPQKVITNVQNYTTKEGQANYLAEQVAAGKITEDQAYQILDEHGIVPLNERNWEMVDDGGINWFWGVDNNAVVRDENGNEYTLKDLKKELQKTMSTAEAKKYIKELQKKLGI